MRLRAALGIALAAGFVGVLAHTTAATQCPMRELGPCAKVHALFMQTRAPAQPALLALVTPMRADAPSTRAPDVVLVLAAAGGRR